MADKKTIKINFCDFYNDFPKENNRVSNALKNIMILNFLKNRIFYFIRVLEPSI